MSQSTTPINSKLIDSLAQIILSLTTEERQLLEQKIQHSQLSEEELKIKQQALQQDIAIGAEQLRGGDYTEYDDASLPSLLDTIRTRGKLRLQQEPVE